MTTLEKLLKTVKLPDGTFVRGAISRVADTCQVSTSTVRKWFSGEWPLSPGQAATIDGAMENGETFHGKKPGPKHPSRQVARK